MEDSKKRQNATSEIEGSIQEKVIQIDRVNKVVSGGKRMAFRAVVISGDLAGKVGIGLGKSKEVPNAIRKAVEKSKKNFVAINMVNGTIPHPVEGNFGSCRVVMKPARPGTGVIAGGAVRILLELVGMENIVAKIIGSNNSINAIKAALDGLKKCKDLEAESKLRGKVFKVRRLTS